MQSISTIVQQFFQEFNRASIAMDMEAILAQFNDPFVYAGANGVSIVTRANFAGAVSKQKQFFDSLYLQNAETAPSEEWAMDDQCTGVRANVSMTFKKSSGEIVSVEQKVSYVLSLKNMPPVIIVYSNPNVLTELLQKAGLMSPGE